MDIQVRKIGQYLEVIINSQGTTILSGLLDADEYKAYKETFQDAADEIARYI